LQCARQQHLDGHSAADQDVYALVDGAHAAFPDQARDRVLPVDDEARANGHVCPIDFEVTRTSAIGAGEAVTLWTVCTLRRLGRAALLLSASCATRKNSM